MSPTCTKRPPIPSKPKNLAGNKVNNLEANTPQRPRSPPTRVDRARRNTPPTLTTEHVSLYTSSSPLNLYHRSSPRSKPGSETSKSASSLDPAINELIQMGFEAADATVAWEATHDFVAAVDILLSKQRTPIPSNSDSEYSSPSPSLNVPASSSPSKPPRTSTSTSSSPTSPPAAPRHGSTTSFQTTPLYQTFKPKETNGTTKQNQTQSGTWSFLGKVWNTDTKARNGQSSDSPQSKTTASHDASKPLPTQPKSRSPEERANQAREEGNHLFKAGKYEKAEEAYSQAIYALPLGHDLLAVVSNNRAAARLKVGRYRLCLDDCLVAIHQIRRIPRPKGVQNVYNVNIQWQDQLVKALLRRASAQENLLKWEDALSTYHEIYQLEPSHEKVQEGLQRVQQQLQAQKQQNAYTRPTPKREQPIPTQSFPRQTKPAGSAFPDIDYSIFGRGQTSKPASKAVEELRAREAKAAAEEEERHNKYESVNSKVQSWQRGKEKDLKGLLLSVHLVQWPGLQWQRIVSADVSTPRDCKKAYLRSIAKIHPDKLPATATTEQKMLASAVFRALNEAWDVYKAQYNL